MIALDQKLELLQNKLLNSEEPIKIMILGLGSVGLYLLDYLVSSGNPRVEIIVVGRNREKMTSDVNIIRTAATIRRQYKATIKIEGDCDFEDIDKIAAILDKWNPDFIINSSRVYSGLKYGSISWSTLRAYGIWTPLSVKFAKNIMMAYAKAGSNAITINTSYSDAVIPWLKSAGMAFFDFGSGNLNHLIPRMKFYIADKFGISDLNNIDVTLAVSHFHDVVISKEGHSEGQDILLDIKYNDKTLEYDKEELLSACRIAMPVDQKRNMMNASSNYDIINSICTAITEHKKIKIHTPGVNGEIGGYPFIIDGTQSAKGYIDESAFSIAEMRQANRDSIYLDGIANIEDGVLTYTLELLQKIEDSFQIKLQNKVDLPSYKILADEIINGIIVPQTNNL